MFVRTILLFGLLLLPRFVFASQVRMVYLIPTDKIFRSEYRTTMENAIRNLQIWYRNEMGNGKGFQLNNIIVETYTTPHNSNWYGSNPVGGDPTYYFWYNAINDGFAITGGGFNDPNNIWLYYIHADPECGQIVGGTSGVAVLPANDLRGLAGEQNIPACANEPPDNNGVCRWVGGLGHELGHAFGLPHPPGCPGPNCPNEALMWAGYAIYPSTYLLPADIQDLNSNSFFIPMSLTPTLFDCSNLLGCDYSITPLGQSFSSAGGNGELNVLVASGCNWTSSSNDPWIIITAGLSGSGAGVISYTVHPNADSGSRSGSINVEGLVFTVVQTGTDELFYRDDFEDGDASDWTFVKGSWSVTFGNLSGTSNRKGTALAPFNGCQLCTIETELQLESPSSRVSLLAWYQDKRNFVEVRLMEDKQKILLKYKTSTGTAAKKSAPLTILSGIDYRVRVTYDAVSALFKVFVDDSLVIDAPTQAIPFGTVGFRIKSTTGLPVSGTFAEIFVY